MITSDIIQKSIRAIRFCFYKDLSIHEQGKLSEILDENMLILFWRLKKEDRAHSLEVFNRMKKITDDKSMHELAIIHDIGKVASDIGWLGRIFADLGYNKSNNAKRYKNHEELGIGLLNNIAIKDNNSEILNNYINNLINHRHELLERCDY